MQGKPVEYPRKEAAPPSQGQNDAAGARESTKSVSGRRGRGKRVFAGVAVKFADEVGALKTRGAQRLVKVEIVLRRIDDAPGNIGAVVGRALETGEKIGEDEAELNAAPALLQTPDVARAHRFLELIDDLLERLDLGGDGAVVFL